MLGAGGVKGSSAMACAPAVLQGWPCSIKRIWPN